MHFPRCARRSLVLTTTLAVAGALVGCGDSVKVLTCPLGTLPSGDRCVPIAPEDVVDADTAPPVDTALAEDTVGPDTATADTAPPVDAAPDVQAPQPIGSPCAKNAECADGTCLDWPGGYCTRLGCEAGGCPEGSACVAVEGGNQVCLATCSGDGDCRSGTQACKRLRDGGDGPVVAVCVGVDPDAGATGAACSDATACAGAAACLAAFPGGYCAAIGCTAASCPSDARCVPVDGEPTCLQACDGDAACDSAPGAERRCGTLDAVGGGSASVCLSGVAERPIGATCLTDFECESGRCEIFGDGRCSQTGGPCFTASAAQDCNGAESCLVTADSRRGVCTQRCGPGSAACPGATYCVNDGLDVTAGSCRPACTVGGGECAAGSSLACRFGIPLSEGAQGRYVCRRERPRGLGASCQSAGDCRSGRCLEPATGAGVCTEPCVGDGVCGFSGSCVYGAEELCYPACFSAADCGPGFSCALATGSPRLVCAP